ncbi:MAG: hypothetical protein GXY32_08820 [Ruminococcaceae bacterium]|nr:hypothetical protein [Oscillospiraceae bacterium]
MISDFDIFDDNTLCITITLAEYRELVRHETVAGNEILALRSRLEEHARTQDGLIEQIYALQERLAGETPVEDGAYWIYFTRSWAAGISIDGSAYDQPYPRP